MSFSTSVPATSLDDLPAVLDALECNPPLESDEAKAAFGTAKAAFEQVATVFAVNEKPICGSISGHWFDGSEFSYPKNSCNLSISETEFPEPPKTEAEPEATG